MLPQRALINGYLGFVLVWLARETGGNAGAGGPVSCAEGANLDLRTLTDKPDMGYHPFTLFSLYRLNGLCAPGLA